MKIPKSGFLTSLAKVTHYLAYAVVILEVIEIAKEKFKELENSSEKTKEVVNEN